MCLVRHLKNVMFVGRIYMQTIGTYTKCMEDVMTGILVYFTHTVVT